MIMLSWLLGLSLFDIRYRSVPVWMVLSGGAVITGIGICGCVWGESDPAALLSGMIPGIVLLLLALGTRKAGWVDGIVLMLLGSILGFSQCILAAALSLLMISVLSAVLLIMKKADHGTTIPYIPFLTMSFVLCRLTGG